VKLSGKVALYMALVFASGAVLGVVGNRTYTAYQTQNNPPKGRKDKTRRPSPDDFRRDYLSFMERRLNLSPEQVTQLGLILDETRAQFEELQRRTVPEQEAIGRNQTDRIRAILTQEQREKFEQLRREREERNKNKGKRDRFGPPGF
jgi:Spy/CpxP family protein refolding chaperone